MAPCLTIVKRSQILISVNPDWCVLALVGLLRVTIRRFFFMAGGGTAFVIDGFNLYHSLVEASRTLGLNGAGTKWLDVAGLCSSYLHLFGRNASLAGVYYFSAKAHHLERSKPGVVGRHVNFANALDVAIATKVLELLHTDSADRVVLVTGDTDLAPAVRSARRSFPDKEVCFLFPWNRKMRELASLAHHSFSIDRRKYGQHQFPDPFLSAAGVAFRKPVEW